MAAARCPGLFLPLAVYAGLTLVSAGFSSTNGSFTTPANC
jgi:hypothetical protein